MGDAMSLIDTVASKYRERGHSVRVLSRTRIEVIDKKTGNKYRVTNLGRVVQGSALLAELAEEADDKSQYDLGGEA